MFIISKSWMDRGTGFQKTGCLGTVLCMRTVMLKSLVLCGQRHVVEICGRARKECVGWPGVASSIAMWKLRCSPRKSTVLKNLAWHTGCLLYTSDAADE